MKVERVPQNSTEDRLERRFLNPADGWKDDFDRIYNTDGELTIGSPELAMALLEQYITEQPRTVIFGGQLGDEGKGRLVDNEIDSMLQLDRVKQVMVIRYQGGSNAGHTIEKGKIKLALHQVPSGIFYTETVGIMDTGMVINVEDLQTEVGYVEAAVGDTREKLLLSERAIHNTDLERAMEWNNKRLSGGAEGSTGRGIRPSYGEKLQGTGKKIRDFLADDWRKEYSERYDALQASLFGQGINLSDVPVPDFKATVETDKSQQRNVGTKEEYLDRLESTREWLIGRDMVTDTITIHEQTFADAARGVLFEGSQAVGLDAWLGTDPDVTGSDTTAAGIKVGTQFWKKDKVGKRMAVIKHNPSSVGVRRMPTHVDLPKTWDQPLPDDAEPYQIYSDYARREAREIGTTTKRFRDMNLLDLPFLAHNLYMGEANSMGITHLDVAREDMDVPVCVGYVSKTDGKPVRYKPDLMALDDVEAQIIYLPGWDGQACKAAKSFSELPLNAQRYLAFIQARTGCPIVSITAGPARDSLINTMPPLAA